MKPLKDEQFREIMRLLFNSELPDEQVIDIILKITKAIRVKG